MVIVKMSCGHTTVAPERWSDMLTTEFTFDCPECGSLEIFTGDVVVKSKGFHKHMHEKTAGSEFQWPADGANTGSIEF